MGRDMAEKAREDGSWRRSTLITHHIDHPPQVKALVDELYATLTDAGHQDYEAAIEAEYATAHERVEHYSYGDGMLSLVGAPEPGRGGIHLTHLIYGGCTAHQIRQDLVHRGLGSLGITWVYPPEDTLPDDGT
ncbi:hypothetical protein [Amycolatopsis sp. CA-230715]|uniref:hypothetical protein n=1 Tax=Amycolatopsis sp. CA-230715 TaxID=2745196 RepID=UPI001C021C94|nr:hypothetical protein [Amycolatopsis sp. CA-230715]QWF77926.1 hypothetical protein HUW46_01319 [Amycolatopsis sp. CA-230715]